MHHHTDKDYDDYDDDYFTITEATREEETSLVACLILTMQC